MAWYKGDNRQWSGRDNRGYNDNSASAQAHSSDAPQQQNSRYFVNSFYEQEKELQALRDEKKARQDEEALSKSQERLSRTVAETVTQSFKEVASMFWSSPKPGSVAGGIMRELKRNESDKSDETKQAVAIAAMFRPQSGKPKDTPTSAPPSVSLFQKVSRALSASAPATSHQRANRSRSVKKSSRKRSRRSPTSSAHSDSRSSSHRRSRHKKKKAKRSRSRSGGRGSRITVASAASGGKRQLKRPGAAAVPARAGVDQESAKEIAEILGLEQEVDPALEKDRWAEVVAGMTNMKALDELLEANSLSTAASRKKSDKVIQLIDFLTAE